MRDALLEAALSRFGTSGYDATTVEDLARDAGIAAGGFYTHFRSKQQVMLVLLDRLLAELEPFPPVLPGDEVRAVFACVHGRFTHTWRYAGVYRAWREAALRDPTLTEVQSSIEAWATMRGAAALNVVAKTPGARRDVDLYALSYMVCAIFLRLLESNSGDREALADAVVTMLTHALFEDEAAVIREG